EDANGADSVQAREQDADQRWPPLLVIWIGGKQHEAVLFADQRPASAAPACRQAGSRIARRSRPDRVEYRPVEKPQRRCADEVEECDRQQRICRAREQIGAQPAPGSPSAVGHCARARHGRPPVGAIRALYQFISAETDKLSARNAPMMMATHSIACPVLVMTPLITPTRSG